MSDAESGLIEHEAWEGDKYIHEGHNGQRLAIVGHSHSYEKDKKDHDNLTIHTVEGVCSGERRHGFFTRIAYWFGLEPEVLFQHVMFFNFIPDCVGTGADRYRRGTCAQYARGEERFLYLIKAHQVDKAIVCSTALWTRLPAPLEMKGRKPSPYPRLLTAPN